MTTVQLTIYAYLDSTWTDITSDVQSQSKVTSSWGIRSNSFTDLVAATGQMKFSLSNDDGKYTPGGSSVISADWKKGTKIKAVFTHDSQDWVRFYGSIDTIRIDAGTSGQRKVHVTVLDWMDYASQYPLSNPAVALDQRIDEAITTILSGMPIQPLATDFDTGANTFLTVFNDATLKTRAYSEFGKLAISEFAPIYLKKDKIYGETLRVESANSRVYNTSIKQVKVTAAPEDILDETGAAIQDEANDDILSEGYTYQDVSIDNTMLDMDVVYGDGLINRITTSANPTRIDDAETNIYTLDSPLSLAVGEVKPFYVQFTENASKRLVSALAPDASYPTTLLHFDAGGSEELIIDEAGKPFDDYSMQLVNNIKVFGAAAAYFDGSGAYIEGTSSTDYEFGNGDFTVEWREYRFNADSGESVINRSGGGGYIPFLFGYSNGTNSLVYMTSNGSSWDIANGVSFGAISTNTWVAYAICRSGNSFYLFKNGTLVNSFSHSGTILASANSFVIGKHGSAYITAVIDEVRITKGLARYTANYTLATEPFVLSGLVYAGWTNKNGTGTEITGDITIDIDYGAAGALVTATNGGSSSGWLTTLKINGKIIETVSPVTDVQEDADSIAEYGYHELSINQPYQQDFTTGREKAATILEARKQPITEINRITANANRDEAHMMYFLDTDIGDLVEIVEAQTETDAAFYIQGMGWESSAGSDGAIVDFWWSVKEFRKSLEPIGIRLGDPHTYNYQRIDFGYLPAVNRESVDFRIWSFHFNSDQDSDNQQGYFVSCENAMGGSGFRGYNIQYIPGAVVSGGGRISMNFISGSTRTRWDVEALFTQSAWNHVLIAYDASSSAAPSVYLNNTLLTTPTAISTASVDDATEIGLNLMIGRASPLWDFTMEDFRIYNGSQVNNVAVLADSLYNEARYGNANTTGLIFRGFYAPVDEVANYEGATLTEEMKVIDSVGLSVGTPKESPQGTAA